MPDPQPWEQVETHIADLVEPESGAVWLGAPVYIKSEVDAARAADQAEIARLHQQIATLQTQHAEQIAEKDRQIAALRAENFELTGRIANALL